MSYVNRFVNRFIQNDYCDDDDDDDDGDGDGDGDDDTSRHAGAQPRHAEHAEQLNSLMFLSAAAWFDPSLVLKGRDLRIF